MCAFSRACPRVGVGADGQVLPWRTRASTAVYCSAEVILARFTHSCAHALPALILFAGKRREEADNIAAMLAVKMFRGHD